VETTVVFTCYRKEARGNQMNRKMLSVDHRQHLGVSILAIGRALGSNTELEGVFVTFKERNLRWY
jgi:hypothetical protein